MRRLLLGLALAAPALAGAHDIWIEPSASLVRPGGVFSLSLVLGNHGNAHRDFLPMGKVPVGKQSLFLVGADGRAGDMTATLLDSAPGSKEGMWTGRFGGGVPGLLVAHSAFDAVMSYAPVRDVKSAKAFVMVSDEQDSEGRRATTGSSATRSSSCR